MENYSGAGVLYWSVVDMYSVSHWRKLSFNVTSRYKYQLSYLLGVRHSCSSYIFLYNIQLPQHLQPPFYNHYWFLL